MVSGGSPFLDVPPSDWLAPNRSAFALSDRYPASPGHSLVVPRRLISSWWELGQSYALAVAEAVAEAVRSVAALSYQMVGEPGWRCPRILRSLVTTFQPCSTAVA